MKEILLTQGKVALVDDEDFEWVNQWNWRVYPSKHTFYAQRDCCGNGRKTTVLMHREIMGLSKEDPREIDHKDHDGLNNQRENLRVSTTAQNQYNQRPQVGKSSRYKGVRWHKKRREWRAEIKLNKKTRWIGAYDSEIEAAHSYDKAAKELFGEFAYTNF